MRYKNHYLFLVLLLLYGLHTKAQKLDSLLLELKNHKQEDTVRLRLLNEISREYQYSNTNKGLEMADSAIALGQKLNIQREIAVGYMRKGENYYRADGSTKQGLESLNKALSYFEQLNSKKDIADCLHGIANQYSDVNNSTKALEYYEKALSINKQINNIRGMGVNLGGIGGVYFGLSDYAKAREYWEQALSLSEQAGNVRGMANHLIGLGVAYSQLGDYPKALECYQKSLKINEQLNNKPEMAVNLASIGALYHYLSNSALALEYLQKALKINEDLNNKTSIAINNQNIGSVYNGIGDYSTAIKHYQASLAMAQQLNMEALQSSCLLSIGVAYLLLKNYTEALGYFKRSLVLAEKLQRKDDILMNTQNIGEVYDGAPDSVLIREKIDPLNRDSIVLEYFNKALKMVKETNNLRLQRIILEKISLKYEQQNNYTKALETYKEFIVIRDSIINDEKEKKMTRLQIEYEFDKKKDSLTLQQQVTDEKLKQQILFAKQQQQQLALNEKELELSNKEKDLQKLAYLKTQADLQNEQLENQGKQKQLIISENEKQLHLATVKSLTQEKTLNVLKQRHQWIYIISGLILLGCIAFFIFNRARLQQARLKAQIATERIEQQQKEAEFQRQLGDISLSALRSQMNPHFIFNCLNSIKLYTTQNNTVAASEYLTKFSRLIRLVLENSRNDKIPLSSEINALRLYVDMEAMRFKEKLKYNISVARDVDVDYIDIPPLLLQPYVENAIWHGLMQKEEGGQIDVAFSMQHSESMLVIDITDNGIGRAKSAELMSKTATKHKSYGMKVTSERLALINKVYKTGANVTIHDLTDNNGQAAGTQVTIKIPVT